MKASTAATALLGAILATGYVSAAPDTDTPTETSGAARAETGDKTFSKSSTIDDYLDYAFRHNRGLKAAEARWRASAEHVNQTGYLPNPEASFEYMFEQHDMQYTAGLSQKIPGFGKLRLKKKIAASHASAAQHDYEAMRLMVFENTIKSFYNYHYLGRATTVTDENVTLLKELEKVLLTRYKAGKARYADVLKVQVEKDRLLNQLAGLKDMRSVKSAGLSAILDLPVNHMLPWPHATRSGDATLPDNALLDMLETLNPELKAMDSAIEGFSLSEKLAKKEYTPDFMIGAGFMLMPEQEDGSEPTDASVMVGITLPLWRGKYRSAANEASWLHKSAVSRKKQLENNLQLDLKEALFDLRDAERQLKLLKESLIPKAKQAFEVAQQEFMAGTTRFMTLIDAQRTLFDLSLKLERSQADREIALGEIGCCVGKYDIGALGKETGDEK